MTEKPEILVVDDDEVMRKLLAEVLTREGYRVGLALSGEDAIQVLQKKTYPLILSDIRMIELSGIGVLREVKKAAPLSVVILMTGFGSMEGALEAIQEGAFDYVSKPFKLEEIKSVVSRALKHWESINAKPTGSTLPGKMDLSPQTMIGKSQRIVEVYKTVARAVLSRSNVLLTGESGTGKELVARAIHENSPRRKSPFVSASGSESDLFSTHFKAAENGVFFLDEVGELTLPDQLKLLRAIQDVESRGADVRAVCATRKDLAALVKEGKFRDDLFYKLNVISIELPPLRQRIEDLPELVGFFLARHGEKNHKAVSHLSEEAMALLRSYDWPGNIRELEHEIERAVAMTNMAVLYPEDFPEILHQKGAAATLVRASQPQASPISAGVTAGMSSLEEMERVHIVKVLEEVSYNKSKASEVLGIDRATLYRKAQRYGIDLRGK